MTSDNTPHIPNDARWLYTRTRDANGVHTTLVPLLPIQSYVRDGYHFVLTLHNGENVGVWFQVDSDSADRFAAYLDRHCISTFNDNR